MRIAGSYAECIEAVTSRRTGGTSDIDLTGLGILQDNRARADDAVLSHRDTISDAAVGAEERAAAHHGASAHCDVRAGVAVILYHGAMPDERSAQIGRASCRERV